MERNGILLILAFALSIGLVACGDQKPVAPAPYADLKAVYQAISDAQDQLAAGLKASTEATKVATALKTYTSKMRELSPRLKEAQARYPEMAKATTPPAELTTTVDALNKSTGQMMESLSQVQKFLEDPAVNQAMDDLTAAARESQ